MCHKILVFKTVINILIFSNLNLNLNLNACDSELAPVDSLGSGVRLNRARTRTFRSAAELECDFGSSDAGETTDRSAAELGCAFGLPERFSSFDFSGLPEATRARADSASSASGAAEEAELHARNAELWTANLMLERKLDAARRELALKNITIATLKKGPVARSNRQLRNFNFELARERNALLVWKAAHTKSARDVGTNTETVDLTSGTMATAGAVTFRAVIATAAIDTAAAEAAVMAAAESKPTAGAGASVTGKNIRVRVGPLGLGTAGKVGTGLRSMASLAATSMRASSPIPPRTAASSPVPAGVIASARKSARRDSSSKIVEPVAVR